MEGVEGADALEDWAGSLPAFDFTSPPVLVHKSTREFAAGPPMNNFLKGAKWSPDGCCILTNSEDSVLRLFDLPDQTAQRPSEPSEMDPTLDITCGETVYDFCWYPYMNSQDPSTCVFLSSSRDHPVRLWDAYTGEFRASYRSYDQMDEIAAPYSVAFNTAGTRIYCGFEKVIRVFDTATPGRTFRTIPTVNQRTKYGQKGILSCISFSPDGSGMYAVGSYTSSLAVYVEDMREALFYLDGHKGGITQVMFSPNSNCLFSGARKDGEILGWDIRNTGEVCYRFARESNTNQRIGFDIDPSGKYLITGSQDGAILAYDLYHPEQAPTSYTWMNGVSTNSASFHPNQQLVATTTGDRKYVIDPEFVDDCNDAPMNHNALLVWKTEFSGNEVHL